MKKLIKNFIFILLIFLIISGIFTLFSRPFEKEEELSLTQLVEKINQGEIKEITVSGNELSIIYQNDEKVQSRKESDVTLRQTIIAYGVNEEKLNEIDIKVKEESGGLMGWLGPLLLILPLLIFGIFFG